MKYLFIGNRRFVLEELLKCSENVEVCVIANTHLCKEPLLKKLNHTIVSSKAEVNNILKNHDYDLMISNGLPFILKLAELPTKPLVNIHPSFLPDLRGVDPVLGSILFKRDAGATCHIIDDGIDTGPLISQVKIPFTIDLHSSLLYPLSFEAEKICFHQAWERDFKPLVSNSMVTDGTIYFTRSTDTRLLPFTGTDDEIIQVVKAFDNINQGARFILNNSEWKCHDIWLSKNPFLLDRIKDYELNSVAMVFEDTLIIKREGSALGLRHTNVVDPISCLGEKISGR